MKINTEKTETMAIGRHTQCLNITVVNDSIKQTNEFKYLGTVFSDDGKIDKEIDIRYNKANQILGQLTL
jgi:beta-glucosidase-like glycosyl hydrolase